MVTEYILNTILASHSELQRPFMSLNASPVVTYIHILHAGLSGYLLFLAFFGYKKEKLEEHNVPGLLL